MAFPFSVRAASISKSGGSSFSPADVSGLQLWLDASRITGLADGAAVATWSDVSGNGRNATQATPGLRPLYKTGILNGMAGVLFDGADDLLAVSYNIPTAFSLFIVYSGRSGANGSMFGNSGVSNDLLQRNAANWPNVNEVEINTSQNLNDNKILVMLFSYTGNSFTVRMDGASVGTLSGSRTAIDAGGVTVGQSYNETVAGYIHEVIFYNALLGVGNYGAVEGYLSAKWGVTLG